MDITFYCNTSLTFIMLALTFELCQIEFVFCLKNSIRVSEQAWRCWLLIGLKKAGLV
ncbi:hypothetical protein GMA8713_02443 [Grimontia marina]|uniref:Uncharacterized protein n=1 Tax=Grimontia marina TaxID=646534 RepID=A0A128F9P5_9GAMM|nr:hypothetical protein GMA8713_02443 [Grimontia marina]